MALRRFWFILSGAWSFSISDWLMGLNNGLVYISKVVSDSSNLHDDVWSIRSPHRSLEYQKLTSNAFCRHSY